MQGTQNSQRTIWIGTICLLIAAWLRLAAFDQTPIGADQSSILAAAANIAAFRDLPLVGIKSSVGVMQTAVTPYLAALPLFIVHKVVAIKWFFSILDILALALLYRAMYRTFGPIPAVISSLLYATNPWVVEFNRWIWYQTLIPTFATTTFASFLLLLNSKKRSTSCAYLNLALSSAMLMGMVHLAAVPWSAVLFVMGAFWAWRKKIWAGFWLGILLSFLIACPYLIFLYKSDFADIVILLSGAGEARSTGWNLAAYRLSRELLSGEQELTTVRSPIWENAVIQIPILYRVVPVFLFIAIAWSVLYLLRSTANRAALLMTLLWTVLSPSIFMRAQYHLQHFYLLFIFPAPLVLIGAWAGSNDFCSSGLTKVWRGLRLLALGMLIAFSLWWTHLWSVRIDLKHKNVITTVSAALMDQAVDTISEYLAADAQRQIIVLTEFDSGGLSPFDWMRNFIHSDRVRVVPVDQGFVIPDYPTCYMLGPQASESYLLPVMSQVLLDVKMSVPATPPWTFYCMTSRGQLPSSLSDWENGLSLLSARVIGDFDPGNDLRLEYVWHYRALYSQEYHFFNHLLSDEENILIAQVDGEGVPTRYWRDDDVLITYFVLPLPATLPSRVSLRTGVYTWPQLERIYTITGDDGYEVQNWQ